MSIKTVEDKILNEVNDLRGDHTETARQVIELEIMDDLPLQHIEEGWSFTLGLTGIKSRNIMDWEYPRSLLAFGPQFSTEPI